MKKKKSRTLSSLDQPWMAVIPFLVGLLCFFLVSLLAPSTVKATAGVVIFLAVALSVIRFSALRDRVTLPFLALTLLVLMDGVSMLYAVSGKFFLNEFIKLISAYCFALALMAAATRKEPGKWIASVLETVTAIAALVSIDLLSTRIVSGAFLGILNLFGTDFATQSGVEAGVRMVSMFLNPNIFAGVAGIGVLLSLGLAASSERGWRRNVHIAMLYINALGFLLAFSMGASGTIAVAFIVFLLLEQPDRRSGSLLLMLETLILTLIPAALISMTSFQEWSGIQPIPLLCVVVGAAALVLLDHFAVSRLKFKLKGKVLILVIAALVLVLGVYAVAAVNVTSGTSFAAGDTLRRAAYPAAGQYTLAAQDAPIQVTVESQNQQETMMHTSSVLYQGPLSDASFTVPEDSLVVYFNLRAEGTAQLDSLACEGTGGSYQIPLKYPLLPGFIANRLQGLFANENAIQRTVFFADGLQLFQRSPVVGLGVGAFENAIRSVQSFNYETKYAHNHYIQSLVETGAIGLILFLALLGVSAAAILLARRKGKKEGNVHPLIPALGAALVFMALHAATEVVFSTYSYLPIAFSTFALIGVCCGGAIPTKWLGKKVRTVILALVGVLVLVFAFLLYQNTSARAAVERKPTMDNLARAADSDPFEWADYMLSYVDNSVSGDTTNVETIKKADVYAERLAQVNSNTIPIHLAEYYFRTSRPEMAVDMLDKYVSYVSSDERAWKNCFILLMNYDDGSAAFREGALRIGRMLDEWNAANMGTITLDEDAQAYLAEMRK